MSDFDIVFEMLTGHPPNSWQRRLYEDRLARGMVPEALDLPTGLGKTSVMALWLIALANGAALPRRLVYVVDRRAVVDQASTLADRLAERAADAFPNHPPPAVSTLRGRHADNRRWLEDPAKLPPLRMLSLSATGRADGERVFRLEQDDRDCWTARRLDADKRLTIAEAGARTLPLSLAMAARALLAEAPSARLLVFAHSRADALKTGGELGGKGGPPVAFLTGERPSANARL